MGIFNAYAIRFAGHCFPVSLTGIGGEGPWRTGAKGGGDRAYGGEVGDNYLTILYVRHFSVVFRRDVFGIFASVSFVFRVAWRVGRFFLFTKYVDCLVGVAARPYSSEVSDELSSEYRVSFGVVLCCYGSELGEDIDVDPFLVFFGRSDTVS